MVLEFMMDCGDRVTAECSSADISMLGGGIVGISIQPSDGPSYQLRIPEQGEIAHIRMHGTSGMAGGCMAVDAQEDQGGATMC